jgi:chitodextrinase
MKIKRHGFTVAFAALVLLATLAFSQQVHATATNTASSTFIFSHNHQLHDTGPDILALQKFLNTHDFAVAQTGPGSPGKETRFFGLATFRALKNYQTAQGLPATGFFGPLTRTALTTFAAGPSSVSDSSSNTTPSTPSNTFRTILPSWFPKAISGGYTPGFGGGGGGGGGSSAPPADTTPPARSAGAPSGTLTLGTTSTTLSLTTDEAATCKYAATAGTAFGSMAAFSTSGGTSHSTSVSGLSNGGSYIYYIKCQDAQGNTNATDYTISFTVAADTISPTVSVTAPSNNATVTGSSVTISANATDDVSVAGVQFKLDTNTNIGAEDTSSPYSVTWNSTGVSDGVHTLTAVARDGSGNHATSSVITVTVDNTAPVLSVISSGTPGDIAATITWTTDEAASSTVSYGLTTSYGTASSSPTLATSHSIILTGLTSGTTYHFQIQSADAQGNIATSSDQTLTTADAVQRNASMGINLAKVNYYSNEQPLLDIFKATTGWITGQGSTWDTGEESKLNLDANGWPTCICGSGGQQVTFTTIRALLNRLSPPYYPAGQYIVLYDGEGTLAYQFDSVKNVALSTPGRDVLDVTPTSSGIEVYITATDPNNTGNYIRNIRVVYAPYESLLAAGEIFNPQFISRITPFTSLRFMDWMETNGSTEGGLWSARQTPSSAFWGGSRSIPVETMVTLANEVGSDPWFNMPIMATDDYITQFTTLVHQQLATNRKVYVEFSNEVWNGTFSQLSYAETQGKALWPTAVGSISDYVIGLNWYGMRTSQMCDIWKSVWGADASRIVCVIGSQAANAGITPTELGCSLWSQAPCAGNHGIDALAIAPYFGYTVPDSWTSDSDGGLGKLFTEIDQGGLKTGGYPTGMVQQALSWIAPQKAIANSYNLGLVGYEGGQGLLDSNDATTTTLYIAANRDARMGSSTATFLQGWQQASNGSLLSYYDDIGAYTKWGPWGALEDVSYSSSPKYDALLSFIATAPPAFDTAAPSAPAGLAVSPISTSQINLSWTASTDNVGVQGYRLFRNGVQIAAPATNSYNDTGLAETTTYSYDVIAYDAAGNQSTQSSSISTTTQARIPVISGASPTGILPAGTTATTLAVTTNINASCGYATSSGVAFSSMTPFTTTGGTSHSTSVSGLTNNNSYTYYVKCQGSTGGTSGDTTISFLVASAVTPSFIETGTLTYSGLTLTRTGANLGTPNTNRRVIVVMTGLVSGHSVSGATIDGVSATIHFDQKETTGSNVWAGIVSAVVPADATGNIVITFTGSIYSNGYCAIYTVDNSALNSTTPTTGAANTANGTSVAPTVAATAGGFLLGATRWSTSPPAPITVGGFTINAATTSSVFFSQPLIGTTGTLTATTTWTGTTYTVESGIAAWR